LEKKPVDNIDLFTWQCFVLNCGLLLWCVCIIPCCNGTSQCRL